MNGPQHQPNQGVPVMPNKQDTAPKWSEDELRIAHDFHVFLARVPYLEGEDYLEKRNRLVFDFVRTHGQKYPDILAKDVHIYTELPQGVRSATSHLAAEAKAKKTAQKADYNKRLLADASKEWQDEFANNPAFRLANDPESDPGDLLRVDDDPTAR